MSFLSDWLLPETAMTSGEQADNYNRLQAEYEARLNRRVAEQTMTQADADAKLAVAQANTLESQDAAAAAGAIEGAAQGLKDLPGNIKTGLAGTINTIFGAIPWQLWAIGAVVLFFYLGGAMVLRGRLAKLA